MAQYGRPPKTWPITFPSIDGVALGQKIYAAREARQMGQTELARRVSTYLREYRPEMDRDITHYVVLRYEAGRNATCDPATAIAFAEVLGLPWDEVLIWREPIPNLSVPELWVMLTAFGLTPHQADTVLTFARFVQSQSSSH